MSKKSKRAYSHNVRRDFNDDFTRRTSNIDFIKHRAEDFENCQMNNPDTVKIQNQYSSNRVVHKNKNSDYLVSPEVAFNAVVNNKDIPGMKTRNSRLQQQPKTENELRKVDNLQWVPDPKNNTNELQNYLTDFRDIQTFSSGFSSPKVKSPSDRPFETFDLTKEGLHSRMQSRNMNENEILNKILNNQDHPQHVYSTWRQQSKSIQSKFIF